MLKKTFALMLALALLACALPTLVLADGPSDSFIPDKLIPAFNDMIAFTLDNIDDSLTQAEKDELAAFMRLEFTENSEENNAFFDNTDWSVEIAAEYGSRLPDPAQPAEIMLMTLHEDGLDANKLLLARVALVAAISACDPSADFGALYGWITEASKNGDRVELDGCHLELKRVENMWLYVLQADATGISLDDSDALKALLSDYLEEDRPAANLTGDDPTPAPAQDDRCIFSWNGFTVELLGVEPCPSDDGFVYTNFYCHIVNGTDRTLNLFFENPQVNGVDVCSANDIMDLEAGSDVGADGSEKFVLEMADYDESREALCAPRTVKVTFTLADSETGEICHSQEVTFTPDDVPSVTLPPAESPTPDPTPEPTPTPNPNLLVDWDGFTVELLRIEPTAFSDGTVDLTFYCRFVNDTGREINMFIDNAEVDSVPVEGIGKMNIASGTDTGPDSTAFFFIRPDSDNDYSAGLNAICDAGLLTATARLTSGSEELYTQPIAIELLDVPSFTPKPTLAPTPGSTSSALDRLMDVLDNRDHSYEYDTLCRGDKGDGVAWMQMELIDLGYLLGEADGVYGAKTAEAVRLFNEANGFGSSDIATPEMQNCLFGNGPMPYEDLWVPLIFTQDSYCHWKKYSDNKLGVRVEVTNSSRTRTIKAFELFVYAVDVYGDRLYGDDIHYYATTTKKVKPGKEVKSDYIVIPNRDRIDRVYIAINKVVFDDGTVHECDYPEYWYWEYNR